MRRDKIIRNSRFEEKSGIKVLYIQGEPYELGYQHGYLLADKIALLISRTLLATAAYVANQTGSSLERAQEMLWIGEKRRTLSSG